MNSQSSLVAAGVSFDPARDEKHDSRKEREPTDQPRNMRGKGLSAVRVVSYGQASIDAIGTNQINKTVG